MTQPRVSSRETIAARAAMVRAQFEANGVNAAQWALDRGFSPSLVQKILRGERACRRGDSHRIAIALGIKDPEPAGPALAA